ncbi:glycosyltransferase family 4 protein [uncultured Jatrophihabitans sp.]|uniref:glycosyltransferase family 4 protein n=1 Tax=uncultured Jatrophihabitans sp. TaxID=1610747 RepID=UPI0035CAE0EB
MRLALVFHGVHKRGGVERSIWEAARHWQHHHEVTIVAADVDRTELDDVAVRQVDIGDVAQAGAVTAGLWRFGRAASRLYSVSEFDHVISFGVQPVPATVAWVGSVHRAWLQAGRRLHEGGLRRHPVLRYALPRHQERLVLERSYFHRPWSRVVVVADQVGSDLERLYGVDAGVVRTVHNGFNPAEFDPARRSERGTARAAWGLPEDAIVVCMVANELSRKGFEVAVRALAEVNANSSAAPMHLVLAGTADPAAYAPLIDELQAAATVHWVGPLGDVGGLHAACDAFVLPTKYEAFCMAIVEALGSGLPVITTTVPGAGDLIEHGVNGLLQHDPNDVAELAGLLAQLLDEPTRQRLTAGAAPSVAELTWPAVLDRAVTLLG